jgi:hypothetical protein
MIAKTLTEGISEVSIFLVYKIIYFNSIKKIRRKLY